MTRLALLFVLLPPLAFGDDVPRAVRVAPGYVATQAGWFFTDEGKARADEGVARMWGDLEACREERATLRGDVVRVSAEPGLTWKGALLLVGGGVALGVTAGILLGKRL